MATYYVRNDGNNANTGLGPSIGQAWQTIQKALGATGISSGDTLYIAPGRYNEFVTVAITSPTTETRILGDPLSTQFSDLQPGIVRWTQWASDSGSATNTALLSSTSKNFLTFRNIYFESGFSGSFLITTSQNIEVSKCVFVSYGNQSTNFTNISNQPFNLLIKDNIYVQDTLNHQPAMYITLSGTADFDANVVIANNRFIGSGLEGSLDQRDAFISLLGYTRGWMHIFNNLFMYGSGSIGYNTTSAAYSAKIYNNIYHAANQGQTDNNLLSSPLGLSFGMEKLFGLPSVDPFGPMYGSRLISAGYANSASVSITSGNAEIPAGGNTYTVGQKVQFTTALGNIVAYQAYVVATVTGTTSFTCTGLTPNISGTIVHRHFRYDADMNGIAYPSTLAPTLGSVNYYQESLIGRYIPSERQSTAVRLTPGSTSNSLTVFLGATNLTFNTANLVARYTRNNAASVAVPLVAQTVGGAWVSGGFCEIDSVNLPGFYRFDLPNEAIANNTTALGIAIKGAVGTNGAYITAELEQPTTLISTTGYKLISDQMGANGILDIIKGSSITVKLQITDVNNKPIPLGSSTCTVEVYSLNNLVETYATTTQYQSNGEMTFVLDTAVTNTPGTYNVYVVRNNGGSDTVLYGPMKLVVSNL